MTGETCDKDIGQLATIYDTDSQNTFVSLYYDGRDKKFLRRRIHAIQGVLTRDEQKNFEKTMATIQDFLTKNRVYNTAIFASQKHDFFKVVPFTVHPPNSLIVDSSPYIRPLAEIADEYKPYTLVLLNQNHVKIFSVSCGTIVQEGDLSAEIMNKHKKGGWSQARFQRLRKGSIHAFFEDAIQELEKITTGTLVLAGPGQAKHEFARLLPKNLQANLLDLLDVDMSDEQGVFRASLALLAEKEHEEHKDILSHLKREVLTDGLAVYGIDETKQAVENGQIEILVVEKGYRVPGWICEKCQILDTGSSERCSNCKGNVSRIDAVEEIIEIAERTGAQIDFIEEGKMTGFGHIAGLLRFK
jgi:peptide chain release factor subunit 1